VLLPRLALRNLARNRRRTSITALAIASGVALLIFASGFGDGMHGQMIDAGIQASAGHVVVQGEGWQRKREIEIVVPRSLEVRARLREALPDAVIVPRVFFSGLLTSPQGSVGVGLVGVDPAQEARVNDIDDKLVEGAYLDDRPDGVVLGKTLAKALRVGVGDKVVLMTQRDGEIESRLFRVRGVFSVGIDEIDGFFAHVPLPAAQRLLGLGDDVTQLAAHIDSHRDTARVTRAARAALADHEGLAVLPWHDALPELAEWIVYDDAGLYVLLLVIALIVAMGITNTVLMSVFERIPEFGVMMALGTRPSQLARLVLAEACLLGAGAVLLGAALGVGLNELLAINGVDFTELAGGQTMEAGGVPLDLHMYPDLSWVKVGLFVALSFAMTVLAAAWPAWKTAKLRPIECLQTQ
jgi:ABC-type lipoprotein release transport system permease subunit